jgi:hypothetical protein
VKGASDLHRRAKTSREEALKQLIKEQLCEAAFGLKGYKVRGLRERLSAVQILMLVFMGKANSFEKILWC